MSFPTEFVFYFCQRTAIIALFFLQFLISEVFVKKKKKNKKLKAVVPKGTE